jgi:hypothetical protein
VRNTGKIFEFVNDIKEISNNINFFIPIYSDADIEIGNIKFSKKYKVSTKHTNQEIIIDIKNSARP